MGPESKWQTVPPYLYQDRSSWPISQQVASDLPEFMPEISINTHVLVVKDSIISHLDLNQCKTFTVLVRGVARAAAAVRRRSFRVPGSDITNAAVLEAEMMVIKEAQRELGKWTETYKQLGPFEKEGIVYVGSRVQSWLKDNWNREAYALIPADHPISRLIIDELHQTSHEGVKLYSANCSPSSGFPRPERLFEM